MAMETSTQYIDNHTSGSKQAVFLCGTTLSSSLIPPTSTSDSNVYYACVPKNSVWGQKKLQVKFLNPVPDSDKWIHGGQAIDTNKIISWANVWYDECNRRHRRNIIPKFTEVDDAMPADIRVRFGGDGSNWSTVGVKAQDVHPSKETMLLDLSAGDDQYKRHIVIHEFGHALGLLHEHQRSDFWSSIRKFINTEEMIKKFGDEAFKSNWDQDQEGTSDAILSAYDPYSIMHYWFLPDWLSMQYHTKQEIEKDRDSGKLTKAEADALLGVHIRQNLANEPSNSDIEYLIKAYQHAQAADRQRHHRHQRSSSHTCCVLL